MRNRLWLAVLAATFLSACAISPRDEKAFIEKTYSEYGPVVQPVRSVTSFTDSLACMDAMLAQRGKPPILITSKTFLDASGKAGTSVKELIITAMSEMSRQSGAFRFVDFEVDLTRQDTVQYLSSLMLGMNALELSPPEYYVSGAVSYIDQNVIAKRQGAGISADGTISGKVFTGDLSYDSDINTSVISLELHLGDMKTRVLLPGVHASNSAVLAKGGAGFDGGGSIKKVGVQFALSKDHTQGTGIAIRTLVELGMVELVGKWLKLPYWSCMSLPQSHPELQRELFTWYSSLDTRQAARLFQAGLARAGYLPTDGEVVAPADLLAAVSRFQADNDLPATGLINFATYERLIARMVKVNPDGMILPLDWVKEMAAPVVAGRDAAPITVFLNTVNSARKFRVGDALGIAAAVNRSAYLYCYYQDVAGNVTQVYPNPAQNFEPVLARFPIIVPDAAGSFSLRFEKPGNESVACFAAHDNFMNRLPGPWRGSTLEPLPGVKDMATVRERIEAVAGPTLNVATLELTIEAEPKMEKPVARPRARP